MSEQRFIRSFNGAEVPLYTVKELITKVVGWSTDRGIIANGTWFSQGTKLFEESGEAATGVAKNRNYLIADSVGDTMVVLINILKMTASNHALASLPKLVEESDSGANKVLTDPDGDFPAWHSHYAVWRLQKSLVDVQTHLWDSVITGENIPEIDVNFSLKQSIGAMSALAAWAGLDIAACLSLAWDEIKDRKGHLSPAGIFIKEEDEKVEDEPTADVGRGLTQSTAMLPAADDEEIYAFMPVEVEYVHVRIREAFEANGEDPDTDYQIIDAGVVYNRPDSQQLANDTVAIRLSVVDGEGRIVTMLLSTPGYRPIDGKMYYLAFSKGDLAEFKKDGTQDKVGASPIYTFLPIDDTPVVQYMRNALKNDGHENAEGVVIKKAGVIYKNPQDGIQMAPGSVHVMFLLPGNKVPRHAVIEGMDYTVIDDESTFDIAIPADVLSTPAIKTTAGGNLVSKSKPINHTARSEDVINAPGLGDDATETAVLLLKSMTRC